jgi:hypothetical protein
MKNKYIIIGIVLMVGAMALVANAGNVYLAPQSISVKAGQTFNVTLSVDPAGSKIYTSMVGIKYPADLVEVKGFTQSGTWMTLSQTGYDLIDNTNGSLIKTAGYPKGLSSIATFGVVNFKAKKDGTGTISITSSTKLLDSTNADARTGSFASIALNVAKAPVTTATSSPSVSITPTPSAEVSVTPSPTIEASANQGNGGLFANLGAILSLGTGKDWLGIIVLIIILVAAYFIGRTHGAKKS